MLPWAEMRRLPSWLPQSRHRMDNGMHPRRLRGFTLIELLITVVIVAILSTVALPLAQLAAQRGKEQELRSALREIRSAIDAYKIAHDEGKTSTGGKFGQVGNTVGESGYPPSLKALVEGIPDPTNPKPGAKTYFLRRVPRDPFSTDSSVPAEDTWGKRSYESPPDAPRSGADVFDVYSLTPGVGLNGVPYKEW